jgi:hypothetical protein
MLHDAEDILCDKLENNSFSTEVDESTDFTNPSYVVTFVRVVNDVEIQENLFPVAKEKIYFMSCFYIRKQRVCLGRTM